MYCLIHREHLAARKYCTGCVRMKPVKFEYVEFWMRLHTCTRFFARVEADYDLYFYLLIFRALCVYLFIYLLKQIISVPQWRLTVWFCSFRPRYVSCIVKSFRIWGSEKPDVVLVGPHPLCKGHFQEPWNSYATQPIVLRHFVLKYVVSEGLVRS